LPQARHAFPYRARGPPALIYGDSTAVGALSMARSAASASGAGVGTFARGRTPTKPKIAASTDPIAMTGHTPRPSSTNSQAPMTGPARGAGAEQNREVTDVVGLQVRRPGHRGVREHRGSADDLGARPDQRADDDDRRHQRQAVDGHADADEEER